MEFFYDKVPRRWRSRLERSPRKRKFGCSNPSRDRPKSQNQVVTAALPNARQYVRVSRVLGDYHVCIYTIVHAKELLLLNGHECRAKVQICSPSTVMVTSPHERKILEWNEKPQTNKQKCYDKVKIFGSDSKGDHYS